jgi:hypothetical protein
MKFRFPVVIIDEDFRSENISGSGIRDLAEAIGQEGVARPIASHCITSRTHLHRFCTVISRIRLIGFPSGLLPLIR